MDKLNNMKSKKEILKFHYEKASGKPCDEMILNHLNYVLDAMEEYRNQSHPVKTEVSDSDIDTEEIVNQLSQINPYNSMDNQKAYVSGIELGLNKGLTINKKDEWISVEDRLPEFNKMVICYSDNKVETLAFTECEGCICVTDFNFYPALLSDAKITHWQPLPTPPTRNNN